MADIRMVTDRFSVAPQIALEDLPKIALAGYRHLISNRPDGESPDQPTAQQMAEAARREGMTFVHAPFVGQPTADAVKAVMAASSKTLAFCRSGTRSVSAWAMAQASEGDEPDFIVEQAQDAGYNITNMRDLLLQMARR